MITNTNSWGQSLKDFGYSYTSHTQKILRNTSPCMKFLSLRNLKCFKYKSHIYEVASPLNSGIIPSKSLWFTVTLKYLYNVPMSLHCYFINNVVGICQQTFNFQSLQVTRGNCCITSTLLPRCDGLASL